METFSVLIPDGEAPHALPVVRCLGAVPGITIHVGSARRDVKLRHSRHVSSFHLLPKRREATWLDQLCDLARATRVDLILPVHEPTVRLAVLWKERLREVCTLAPMPDLENFDRAVDKGQLAHLMKHAGIPHPHTLDCNGELEEALKQIGFSFPAIVKACRGSFGRQVYEVPSAEALFALLEKTAGDVHEYIAQPYIDGYDIDASVLCQEGRVLAWTMQRERLAIPDSFEPPLVVEFFHDDPALSQVRRLMEQLRWTGVAHIDMRYDEADQQIKVLEINARFWGSLLGSLTAGINFPYLACQIALGASPAIPISSPGLYFGRGITGRVRSEEALPYSWRRGNLPYILADPMPEVLSWWKGRAGN